MTRAAELGIARAITQLQIDYGFGADLDSASEDGLA